MVLKQEVSNDESCFVVHFIGSKVFVQQVTK